MLKLIETAKLCEFMLSFKPIEYEEEKFVQETNQGRRPRWKSRSGIYVCTRWEIRRVFFDRKESVITCARVVERTLLECYLPRVARVGKYSGVFSIPTPFDSTASVRGPHCFRVWRLTKAGLRRVEFRGNSHEEYYRCIVGYHLVFSLSLSRCKRLSVCLAIIPPLLYIFSYRDI